MRNLLLFIFSLSFTAINAQIDTVSLKSHAQQFIDAYIAEDFQELANMSHPNFIKMSGNLDFVKSDYESDYNILKDLGFKFISGEVGSPGEVFQSGAEYLCFIPQLFTVELNGKKYLSTIPVLATSMTKGKVWSFVALDRQDQSSISTFVPSYEERMGWPTLAPMEEID